MFLFNPQSTVGRKRDLVKPRLVERRNSVVDLSLTQGMKLRGARHDLSRHDPMLVFLLFGLSLALIAMVVADGLSPPSPATALTQSRIAR
jgi:hypothetical protein